MVGEILGNYRIMSQLGEGGMGVVYVAEHTLLEKRAAIKLLQPDLSRNQELVRRFFNEARAATRIAHAGIIDIYDFGYTQDGRAYIIMEYLHGCSLTDRIAERGRLTEEEVVRIGRQVGAALSAAHTAGIIHRDLKPDNIFLVRDGEVAGGERAKVLDFGIAKLTSDSLSGVNSTKTGSVLGSPAYMSPEQGRGAGDVDARTDVYSLGCVLFEMATGQPPYDGGGLGEVIAKHIYEPVPSPRTLAPELSEQLASVIMRCLAKEPATRFSTMRELVEVLDGLSQGRFATAAGAPAPTRAMKVPAPAPTGAERGAGQWTHTTLGGSAGQSLPMDAMAPPTRARWPIAVAGVALLAGVGALAFTQLDGAPDEQHTATPAPPPTPAPAIEHAIESTPPGAQVFDGDRLLGVTPYHLERAPGEAPRILQLRLEGHQAAEVTLAGDRSRTEHVALVAAPAETVPETAGGEQTTGGAQAATAPATAPAEAGPERSTEKRVAGARDEARARAKARRARRRQAREREAGPQPPAPAARATAAEKPPAEKTPPEPKQRSFGELL